MARFWAVALIALLAGCSTGRTAPKPAARPAPSPAALSPTESPPAPPAWLAGRIPLGLISALAVAGDSVYAIYLPPPASGGFDPAGARAVRIDRVSHQVIAETAIAGATGLALDADSLWVGAGYWPDSAAIRPALYRLNASDLAIQAQAPLAAPDSTYGSNGDPALPVAAGRHVWLAYGGHLYRADPATAQTAPVLDLPGSAVSASADPAGGLVYVGTNSASDAYVVQAEATTGRRLLQVKTGGGGLGGAQVAAAEGGVWVAYATGMLGGAVRLRASDLGPTVFPTLRSTHAVRVSVAGSIAWVVDGMANRIACLDAATGTVRALVEDPVAGPVAGDLRGLYLGAYDGLYELRPDRACGAG